MHVTPWIHDTAYPDTSSLKRLLAHPRFKGKQGEALAIEVWKWAVDPVCGFYHFWSPGDRDVERPYMKLDYVKDPLKLVNSYGYMLCGTVAAVFANVCEAGGVPARIIGVTGHTLNEAYFDGGWHLFDCDMPGYYRKRDGDHAIASLKECLADHTLISNPYESITPYGLPDRSPEGIADGCYKPGVGGAMPRHIQQFHAMDYVLRPGEHLIRWSRPVGNRWHFPKHWVAEGKGKNKAEWKGRGPRERFPPHRSYFNGVFRYEPDLTDQSRDVALGAWQLDNVAVTVMGLAAKDLKQTARATWLIQSPWVITGKPEDSDDSTKKREGVVVELEVSLPNGSQSEATLLLSADGEFYEVVASTRDPGNTVLRADLTEQLDRMHRALIAVELKGAAVAKRLKTETWFSHAHNAYPYLGRGPRTASGKTFAYHGGDEAKQRTLSEVWRADIESGQEAFDAALVSSQNLKRGPSPHDRLSAVDPAKPWSAVFAVAPRVLAPCPIARAWVWASQAAWQGEIDEPPPADYNARKPKARIEVSTSPDGPWTLIKEEAAPLHKERYHYCIDGEHVLAKPAQELFVRVTSDTPGWEVMARVTCALPNLPAADAAKLPQLEIIHEWQEGTAEKRHGVPVSDPSKAFEYTVPLGPGEIQDLCVTFRVASSKA